MQQPFTINCSHTKFLTDPPPRLDLKIYPYLPRATVATTSARAYLSLLAGGAAS